MARDCASVRVRVGMGVRRARLLLSLDEAGKVRVFGFGRYESVDHAAADGDALRITD